MVPVEPSGSVMGSVVFVDLPGRQSMALALGQRCMGSGSLCVEEVRVLVADFWIGRLAVASAAYRPVDSVVC